MQHVPEVVQQGRDDQGVGGAFRFGQRRALQRVLDLVHALAIGERSMGIEQVLDGVRRWQEGKLVVDGVRSD
jgi:hypothetical protein